MKTISSVLLAVCVCALSFVNAFAADEVPTSRALLPEFDPVGVTSPKIFHEHLNVVFSALEQMRKEAVISRDRSCMALINYVEETTKASKWFKTTSKKKKDAFNEWVTAIRTNDCFLRLYIEASPEFQDFRQCRLFAYYRSTKSLIYAVHEEINAQINGPVVSEYNRIRAHAYASVSFK